MNHDRAITAGGLAFPGLTFAAIFLLLPGVAGGDTTNAEAAAWAGDGAHRTRAIVGAYLMCGGAMALTLFVAGMVGRLRAVGAGGVAIDVARLSGIAVVVCQLIAGIAMAGTAYAVAAGNESTPIDPAAARITTFGLAVWLVPGMISASVFVASVGLASLAAGAFPTWVSLSALLVAVVLLAAITFLPAMLLLLWSAVVALVAAVRRQPEPGLAPSAAAPP